MSASYSDDLTRALRAGAPARELARIVRGTEPDRDPVLFKSISAEIAVRAADPASPEAMAPVWATHSSTNTQDMHGTWWAPSALQRMLTEAKGGLAFMNHRYDVPEDVFGTITDGTLVSRITPSGAHHMDLDMATSVEAENPRAVKTYRMIRNGTRLGQSVGIMLLGWEWQDPEGRTVGEVEADVYGVTEHERPDARLTITDLAFMESSVVGIPSNRRSWQHSATRALERAGVLHGTAPAQYGGITLPAIERIGNVTNGPDTTAGPAAGAEQPAVAVASGDPAVSRALPADDTAHTEGPTAAESADSGAGDADAGDVAATIAALSGGFVDDGTDLDALDAAFNTSSGIADDLREATALLASVPDPEKDAKRAKKAAKAARKAEKAANTADIAPDAPVAADPPPVVAASAPPPAPTPAATHPALAALDQRIADLKAIEKRAAKTLKKAARAIAQADDTGLYRPTTRDALAKVALTATALVEMSDDDLFDALAAGIVP